MIGVCVVNSGSDIGQVVVVVVIVVVVFLLEPSRMVKNALDVGQ